MRRPFDKYNEWRCTPQTSCEPSRCSTPAMKPTTVTMNERDADNSYILPYKCSAMTIKPGTSPQTSSTPLLEQFVVTSSSRDRMTKPHRPQEERSFMGSCKSSEMTPSSTLSTTPVNPSAVHPQLTWTSCSSSGTRRYLSKNSTSFGHHGQLHHTSHIQGRHPQTSTIAHACLPPRSWKNSGSYPEMTGTETSKGWRHNTTTLSQDWGGDRWTPPSTDMTSSPTTPNSSYREDATAPIIHALSGRGKTPTPEESSLARRRTPSSLGRPSRRWLISPSNKREMRPSAPKCNASATPTIKSETWPKTWPISRSCTTTHAGKNKTPCGPLPVPTPSTASSHASSMMPRRPRISHEPCSMLGLMILRTGGSTAPNSMMSSVNGAKDVDTPHVTAPESTNACSATGMDTKSSSVALHTSNAEWEECAMSPTTTRGWPTPIAHRMSGPSDDGKDANKGVMSQEMPHT
jgi:hypothetical protein